MKPRRHYVGGEASSYERQGVSTRSPTPPLAGQATAGVPLLVLGVAGLVVAMLVVSLQPILGSALGLDWSTATTVGLVSILVGIVGLGGFIARSMDAQNSHRRR